MSDEKPTNEQRLNQLLEGLRKCILDADQWSCDYKIGVEIRDMPGEICFIRTPNKGMTVTIKIDGGAEDTRVGP